MMETVTTTEARKRLYSLVAEVAVASRPVQIKGKQHSAILVSQSDWNAIQETLYLLSIPGMAKSIRAGLETPIEECAAELEW